MMVDDGSLENRGKKPPPAVLCLIVCEQIIVDQGTGNRTLVGIFSNIWAASFPAVHPRMGTYVELTNGHGQSEVKLSLIDARTDEELLSAAGSIEFPDPRMVANLHFSFHNIVFPRPSEYRFQLWADGELLVERRIIVAERPKEHADEGH